MRETPINTYRNLSDYNGIFNWTMTYRSDSDIYCPHGIFMPYKNVTRQDTLDNVHPVKNYAAGKTGLVSWFVSHCVTKNKREQYVSKLKKFVSVDIYGGCSPQHKECDWPRGSLLLPAAAACMKDVMSHHKFYLAFENCNCREYVTEKFWRNALDYNSVPIVMGAPREGFATPSLLRRLLHNVDDFETVNQGWQTTYQKLDAD
ncbi:PREDICTED: glycoprotein 3-alpha-L-fucosyltransferase A-like [Priapulus caudatus]|uniref:Fucosyltransferase n=1 Tax=Priapulus caudatus TaxID=37621 RepID=A0ABM1EQD6_PRICU|nr:PREDICTED: glycoprotein 3-alpha-L-fucosyltransferase A-like [Priapulus caudatus]